MRPELHSTVFDTTMKRTGEVMGFEGPYVQLRPLRGGCEWDAKPENLSPAMSVNELGEAHQVDPIGFELDGPHGD
ncbi:hypothetical protein [Streptomyces spectabilis]|uniref:Uncharacterized protein n=1 Tax=Streptomyces spectabilis TaxID=68270 RepID=A0A5P2X586_STRST|nr:hypothetical protein [Streptomyces spectabilis]MBB5103042.1 hypothetical protein [Streptomyces spectabilis]MCI3902236.1 hypothetical protein [Streptomyces spectabilis]QEV59608.1 hypothetical protein CP982_13420 [Streptomyces spectabilis]GGV15133.1 hypothetical protein GCM10010245_26240 [Streptomyces spectabilis]